MSDAYPPARMVEALAWLYPNVAAAQLVVESAGVDPVGIEFKGAALYNWQAIFDEARRQGKLDALLDVVSRGRYGANPEFVAARQTLDEWLAAPAARQPGPPEPSPPPDLAQKARNVPSVLQPSLGERGVGVLGEPVPPAASQDVSRVGRELHWDRETVVNKFVDVVKRTPGKKDIRVFVIPAPAEADPESLMRRLDAICEELGRTPGTWPRPNCAPVQLRSGMQVSEIVAEILSVLASKGGECADLLDQTRERIENEWRPRRTPEPSPATLAKDFTACLTKAAETCYPVILLHGFHNLPEDGQKWLKTGWLTRHAPDLQDVLVVLAGASGLDGLSRPPHMLSFDPLPKLTVDQLFAWAREGHNLKKVTREKVARVNDAWVDGNPARFYTCIIAWKTDEELEAESSPA